MKKLLLTLVCLLSIGALQTFAQCGAGFTWFVNTVNPPVAFFTDSSFGSFPLTYQWDFGDGTGDTGQFPTHTYAVIGNYNACLTITDALGCTNTSCDSVSFFPPPPSLNCDIYLDSMSFFHCTAPQYITFYYYASATGYSAGDSIKFNINYGDGIDSVFYLPLTSTGFQGSFIHQYINSGNYTVQLTITGPDLQFSTSNSQTITISSTCGSVIGKVYNDFNGNCSYDAGEEMSNIALAIHSNGQYMAWANSDVNGDYSFNVPTGSTYEIHLDPFGGISYGNLTPTCPPTGIISVASVPSSGNNFGVTCPAGFDLRGNVSGWGFRPGFVGSICINAFNQTCTSPPSGTITLTFPSIVTPLPDSTGTSYIVSGQTVTYQIDSTQLYWMFCVPVLVSTGAQIGDSVCVTIDIQPSAGDNDPSNNTGTYCFGIRNSWDPNDKAVVPAGEGPQGYIRPNTDLTYTIRFQNTGNAEAINIYLLDTLDVNLDETSIELIGTSHNTNMSLLAGRILRFDYPNIMLADSNTNEPASHGYVNYTIKQKTNVPQMAVINNTAGIYFDFNPPVITNTTVNTVDQFLSVPVIKNQSSLVNVYPNPANGKCELYFNNTREKVISVSDVLGKEILRHSTNADIFLMNTENFAEGIYTVQIIDNGNDSDTFKLLVAH